MIRRRGYMLVGFLSIALTSGAHEGEMHEQEKPLARDASLASFGRPHRLPNGDLYVSKAVQRLLGIRTDVWPPHTSIPVDLVGEVQAQATAAVTVNASAPGRIEAAETGWLLAGEKVRSGQLLAWLRPAVTAKDAARRRAQLAEINQKRIIADIDVQRLTLQNAVNGEGGVASGNIYYEQALAERAALMRQQEQLDASLEERVPLRAPAGGRLLAVAARPGEIARLGEVLFQISDDAHLRISAQTFDSTLGEQLLAAVLLSKVGPAATLHYRGIEPLTDAPGWRLLFDVNAAANLSPGQMVDLQVETRHAPTLPLDACSADALGRRQLWLHSAPERFTPIAVTSCSVEPDSLSHTQSASRWVLHGAAALAAW